MSFDAGLTDTLIKLFAAWMLIAGAAYWANREGFGLSRRMLIASGRGLLQLLALAFVLHWVFDIQSHLAQAALIAGFCIMGGHNSASHYDGALGTWLACAAGLACACLLTLPWLALSGAISSETRTLVPLGSMVAANGMNAISIMIERLKSGSQIGDGVKTAMIPTIDTLRVVGLVHMPGIFVGMLLAGAAAFDAAVAQLTVLYMVVTSSFAACLVSFLLMNHLNKAKAGQ
ncbi:putative ABC transport system permease protein [Mariprofundus ferrinatatus]|uniref:Putative ABC transport system permease protein n=1 Tax=Mariprofundus ferrinatatus TaxID=1921087 RepID=A0A2K8LAT8_9PROT|nr:ABC transporter permease [Mariprofundus ferrinatatus]ATX83011.1 putative ABC transport system permease protein [Mariprofundus ferrinatatus]